MTSEEKLAIIHHFPLFACLNKEELASLAEKAKEKVFPPHTEILSQNNPATEVLLIYKGLIEIYIFSAEGKIIPIRTKGHLYITGEINIVDSEKSATIETLQETYALSLSLDECRRLVLTYPTFGFELLKIIVEKLRAANRSTEYYFSVPLKERTWAILQDLASYFPNKEITLSHEELANIIGATRARITEVLQELKDDNRISISHRKISIH